MKPIKSISWKSCFATLDRHIKSIFYFIFIGDNINAPKNILGYKLDHLADFCPHCLRPIKEGDLFIDIKVMRRGKKEILTQQTRDINATLHICCFEELCKEGKLSDFLNRLRENWKK